MKLTLVGVGQEDLKLMRSKDSVVSSVVSISARKHVSSFVSVCRSGKE